VECQYTKFFRWCNSDYEIKCSTGNL